MAIEKAQDSAAPTGAASALSAGLERGLSRRVLPALNPVMMAFVAGLNAAFGFAAALDDRDFALYVVMGIGFGFMSAANQWMLVRSNVELRPRPQGVAP